MNRRIRNRTYGGVGGGRREAPPYPIPRTEKRKQKRVALHPARSDAGTRAANASFRDSFRLYSQWYGWPLGRLLLQSRGRNH